MELTRGGHCDPEKENAVRKTLKVRVKTDEDIINVKVTKVFRSVNPITFQNNVNLMLEGSGKGIRLYCGTEEDAKALVGEILEGKAADLTEYTEKWNM